MSPGESVQNRLQSPGWSATPFRTNAVQDDSFNCWVPFTLIECKAISPWPFLATLEFLCLTGPPLVLSDPQPTVVDTMNQMEVQSLGVPQHLAVVLSAQWTKCDPQLLL